MNDSLTGQLSRRDKSCWALLCLLFSALGCWLAVIQLDQPLTGIDDANIFFTYASNLANGEGFVYNAGGERVEGFTSLAWTLVCALGYTVSRQPELLLLCFNTLLVALAMYQAGVFVVLGLWSSSRRPPAAWMPLLMLTLLACWLLATPRFMIWTTVTLMDTGLWCTVLTCGTIAFARAARQPAGEGASDKWLVCWTVLMLLTRPESMLVAAVWIALLALLRQSDASSTVIPRLLQLWRNARAPLLAYLVCLSCLTLFRLLYFGYPLPNTYYAKVSPDLFYNLKLGMMYFVTFVGTQLLMIPAVLVVLVTGLRSSWSLLGRRDVESPDRALVAAVVGCCLFIPVLTGGDHFNLFRFYQPVWVLLAVPMLLTIGDLLRESGRLRRSPLAVIVGAAASGLLFYNIQFPRWNELADAGIRVEFEIAAKGRRRGRLLNRLFPDSDVSLGVGTAGGVGLAYKGPVVDLLGLNNVAMGHSAGDRKGGKNHAAFNQEVFFEQLPDMVRATLLNPGMREPISRQQFLPPEGDFWDTALGGLERRSARFRQLYRPLVFGVKDEDGQIWRFRAWCRPGVIEKIKSAGALLQRFDW